MPEIAPNCKAVAFFEREPRCLILAPQARGTTPVLTPIHGGSAAPAPESRSSRRAGPLKAFSLYCELERRPLFPRHHAKNACRGPGFRRPRSLSRGTAPASQGRAASLAPFPPPLSVYLPLSLSPFVRAPPASQKCPEKQPHRNRANLHGPKALTWALRCISKFSFCDDAIRSLMNQTCPIELSGQAWEPEWAHSLCEDLSDGCYPYGRDSAS